MTKEEIVLAAKEAMEQIDADRAIDLALAAEAPRPAATPAA